MPSSKKQIKDLGEVMIYRRKGLKNMTLRVSPDGTIRLSLPWYVPKAAGMAFVNKKMQWLKSQTQFRPKNLVSGTKIGKLTLLIAPCPASERNWKVTDKKLIVNSTPNDEAYIKDCIKKALKAEARNYLPSRLSKLARQHGFDYKKTRLSSAATRWGSCSEKGTISLNIQLMRLPEHLIDYVLIHELCHTRQMNHSQKFWALVEEVDPSYKLHRREIRAWHPYL